MQLIDGVVRNYDWGSTTAIPELLGRPVTGEPVAELWLGAHPSAPSTVGSEGTSLDEVLAADLVGGLGTDVAERFGSLPFLLKILAAAEPLSLQAHPSIAQAVAGFAHENELGVPLDAPNRSFRDRNHKPELICALTEFHALCGFRDPGPTLDVLATIDTPALDVVREMIGGDPSADGLRRVFEWLLRLGAVEASNLVTPVVAACRVESDRPFGAERAMAASLGDKYPADAGVITALLLNLVVLQPGEALFLDAGNLHAYLHGTGVEVMANSDNVVRGGLTSKHVDVETLVALVDTTPIVPVVQRPALVGGAAHYAVPVDEFTLTRFEVEGTISIEAGPAILLCTDGRAECEGHTLERGSAAWTPAADGPITLAGRATVFRAGVGPAPVSIR